MSDQEPRKPNLSLRCLVLGLLTGVGSGGAVGLLWFHSMTEPTTLLYALLIVCGYGGIAGGFIGGLVGLLATWRQWPGHTAEYIALLIPILSMAILAALNAVMPLF